MKINFKKEWEEYKLLMRSVPSLVMVMFVVGILSMNLLANKSVDIGLSWWALDCGTMVSWIAFMAMDMLIKRFGPKASTEISLTATFMSLCMCGLFFVASRIPGVWGESFVDGSSEVINTALNNTFGGVWYVVLGSAFANICGSLVNIFSNWGIGKLRTHDKDSFKTFAIRSYVSSAVGQLVDNFVFTILISLNFFGWSFIQCVACSITTALVELVCEIVCSPLGYKIVRSWELNGVGNEYLKAVEK